MEKTEPEATRYTLRPAPDYAVSHFAIGLLASMAHLTAKTGSTYTMAALATDSGIHANTLAKLMRMEATFDATTLAALAVAVGHVRWEDVSALGQRVALLMAERSRELEDAREKKP